MKKTILLLFFVLNTVYPQYTKNDKGLVRTTYERKFEKSVILECLNSGDIKKINSALLSIGNSNDTTFIPDILKIDFRKNAEFICFALGQLGRSDTAEVYLAKQLGSYPDFNKYIVPALNRVSQFPYVVPFTTGSSLGLYNYSQRKAQSINDMAALIVKEVQKRNDFYSAFGLYRVGPPESSKEIIITALKEKLDEKDYKTLPYLIGCLRKLKACPAGKDLFLKLLSLKDFQSRIEAVKLLSFYNHNEESLRDYLSFFNDKNYNVKRQAAISLSDIKGFKNILLSFIEEQISLPKTDEATKNELLLSFVKISGSDFAGILNKFKGKIAETGFIQAAQLIKDKDAGNYISSIYRNTDYRNKVLILSYTKDTTVLSSVTEKLKLDDPKLAETLNDSIKVPPADFDLLWEYAFQYKEALIITSKGNIRIKLMPQYAPLSVGNFCYLASKGYFNNNIFHRVVPGFVIQTGDTTGTGWSGPGYSIRSEFSPIEYKKGILGMASSGKDTEGSQWFITNGNFPHLNERYSVFGEVIQGQDIADTTIQEDKVISVKLIP